MKESQEIYYDEFNRDVLKELSSTNLQKDEFDRLRYLISKVLH